MSNIYTIEQFKKGKPYKSKSVRSTGDKLFSYSTIICQRLEDGTTIGNITKYSPTTSRHQSMADVKYCDFVISKVPIGASDLECYLTGL